MRIGDFARYYSVTKATIRYYTDINLLLPVRDGAYYNYDEVCHKDMEDVIRYQRLGFTNNEILNIKKLQRFYINENVTFQAHIKRLIMDKMEEHKGTIKKYKTMIKELNQEYERISINSKNLGFRFGVPLQSIGRLRCRYCRSAFEIKNASIKNQLIVSGDLHCMCNHHLAIKEGIISNPDVDITFDEDIKVQIDTESSDLNKFYKHLNKITHYNKSIIDDWNHDDGIIITHARIDLTFKYFKDCFRDEGHYIFCFKSMEHINIFRILMSANEFKGHIIVVLLDSEFPFVGGFRYMLDSGCNVSDMLEDAPLGSNIALYSVEGLDMLLTNNFFIGASKTPANEYLSYSKYNHVLERLGYRLISNYEEEDVLEFGLDMFDLSKHDMVDIRLCLYDKGE